MAVVVAVWRKDIVCVLVEVVVVVGDEVESEVGIGYVLGAVAVVVEVVVLRVGEAVVVSSGWESSVVCWSRRVCVVAGVVGL